MTAPGFRKGKEAVTALKKRPFETALLPDEEKERLCRDLLAEFGVTSVQATGDGELIHSCCLPYGRHKNGDSAASASLNYKLLVYNCLGCGSSGGFLWFIASCRGEDADAARAWLDDQTGAGPDEQSLSSLLQFFDSVYGAKKKAKRVPIPKMSQRVLEPWLAIHPYMTEDRGVSEQALMRHKVGYAPKYKVRQGDTFIESPRIVIPHFWKGDLVGWQTRRLVCDGTPKYLSSPDFPKDVTLYNYDARAIKAVVIESPMSALVCADDEAHYEATFGAKVTDRQKALLANHRILLLWFDNDEAGWNATAKVADYAEDYSSVWVVDSPWQQDAGDLPPAERVRLVADPVPYALWKPPTSLRCFDCQSAAHEGACA